MTTATASVDALRRAIIREVGSGAIRDLGVFDCRKKRRRDGTIIGGWSEHAWANAWDFRVDAGLRPTVNATLRRLKAAGTVAGWIDYGDGQYHVAGSPRRSTSGSVPPCAGGKASRGDPPPVLQLPSREATAGVPGPGERPGRTQPGGIRSGSPASRVRDRIVEPVSGLVDAAETASEALGALTAPDLWARVAWGVLGLLALVVGAAMLVVDLAPAGRIARAASAVAPGGGGT